MNKYVVCCDNAMVASRLSPYDYIIVSVLYQNEGGVGKSIPDAQEISQDLRDVPRAQLEANLAGRGGGFPNNSRVLVEYGQLFIIRECAG